MDDLISRQATIDAMEGVDWYHINKDGQLVHGANSDDYEPLYKAKDVYAVLNKMPSAQPVDKDIDVPVKDCISRQAVLKAINNMVKECESVYVTSALRNLEVIVADSPSAETHGRTHGNACVRLYQQTGGD